MGRGVLSGHFSGDLLDIFLPLDVDAGDAGQVDDGEIGSVIGVDTQLDGIVDDLSALPCHFVRQFLYVSSHLSEVGVLLACGVVLEDSVGLAVGFA